MPNKSTLRLQYTNFGFFDRAFIDDKRISRERFTQITGISTYGKKFNTWEFLMENCGQTKYNVEFIERDVS